MYRQISQEPLNYFLILVQDIKDKLLKWTVDLCDGLKRCSNSTNVHCCVQEFLWANGSVILSDTDVTGRITKSILTVIADFKEGPANVISTISCVLGQRTKRIYNRVDCGVGSLQKIVNKKTYLNAQSGNANISAIIEILKNFQSSVDPKVNNFLKNKSITSLIDFLSKLDISIGSSIDAIKNKFIPSQRDTVSAFNQNFLDIANKTIQCRVDTFLESFKKYEKLEKGCYLSKFQRNAKRLMKRLRWIFRKKLGAPYTNWEVLLNKLKDKLNKWSVGISNGLDRCLNSTNIDCCIDEFVLANGTIILRDTNATNQISSVLSNSIDGSLDNVGSLIVKTIADNYQQFNEAIKCCVTF
ncbi:unnamed protein product [Diamesa hyperborea]